jgi:hypothetical protein
MDDDELRAECVMAAARMWSNSKLLPTADEVLATAKRFYAWCLEDEDE